MCMLLSAFEGFWILNYYKLDFIELKELEEILRRDFMRFTKGPQPTGEMGHQELLLFALKLSKENCQRWNKRCSFSQDGRPDSLNPKTVLSLDSFKKTQLSYGLMAAADKLWDLVFPFPQAAPPTLGPTASPRENNAFVQAWSKLTWLKKRRCIQRSLHAFQICNKFPISNSIHLSLAIELCALFTDKWEWNVNSSQMSKIYRLSHWGSATSI